MWFKNICPAKFLQSYWVNKHLKLPIIHLYGIKLDYMFPKKGSLSLIVITRILSQVNWKAISIEKWKVFWFTISRNNQHYDCYFSYTELMIPQSVPVLSYCAADSSQTQDCRSSSRMAIILISAEWAIVDASSKHSLNYFRGVGRWTKNNRWQLTYIKLGQFILEINFLQINCTLYIVTILFLHNSRFFLCLLNPFVLYQLPGITIILLCSN